MKSLARAAIPALVLILLALPVVGAVNVLRLGTPQGLSNNYIMDIAQDRNGYVWISTEAGLNRFDGTGFIPFIKGGTNAPAANELNRIYADTTANVLWIATQRHGLDRLDCNTYEFTHYEADKDNPRAVGSPGITDISPASKGGIWIATYTDGIDYLNTDTGDFRHYNSRTVSGWPDDHVWTMAEGRGGKVYVGHVNGGFSIFDPETGALRNYKHNPVDPSSLPGNGVRAVLPEAGGSVWVGTDGGLALYNPTTDSFTCFRHEASRPNSLISNNVYHLMLADDNRLWVSTENGGISVLDIGASMLKSPAEIGFTNYQPDDSDNFFVGNKTIHCTFEDKFGNIWIGTYGDGIDLLCHGEQPFGHIKLEKPATALAILGDSIFAGLDGGGLLLIKDGKSLRSLTPSGSALSESSVMTCYTDANGKTWLGTYDGRLAVIMPGSETPRLVSIPQSIDIRAITTTPDGNILIGNGYGLIRVSPEGQFIDKFYTSEGSTVNDEWIRSLLIHPDGNIWVGSFGGGISVYSPEFDKLYQAATWTGLPSNTVNHLICTDGDKVWAATGEGLVRLTAKAEIDTVIGLNSGLADDGIRALSQDAEGNLWISTAKGISLLDKKGKISNFGAADGIAGGDFSHACVAIDKDHSLFFGSHFGIQTLNSDLLSVHTALEPPVISEITVYGSDNHEEETKIFATGGKLSFPYDHNTLRISFNTLDAAQASAVDYYYKVDGIDNRWYSGDSGTGIFLRNLAPGNYKLDVKAVRRNSPEDFATTELLFSITPPLWATWWAKLIYVLLAIAALTLGIRFYKKRLDLEYALTLERRNSRHEQELNAERMRFFTNITHELRTPLTLILGPLDDMKADKTLSQSHSKTIALIHKSASRLLELINNILEFRKTETQNRSLRVCYGDIVHLVNDLGQRYQGLNSNHAVTIEINIAEGDYRLWHDPEILSIIIDNLLSNACKYTVSGSITLSLYHTTESGVPFTEIAVSDTGIGMSEETLNHIFDRYYRGRTAETRLGTGIGLALVYNLVKIHEGEIFAESQPERGTVFRGRLHTDNTYPAAERRTEGTSPRTDNQLAKSTEEDTNTSTARPTVLVVEDNIDIINYIRSTLSETYEVVSATNGSEGLARAREIIPDIIISDIMMPKMDGITMLKALKTSPDTEYIPVTIVTAKVGEDARKEAYEAGADSYITKPFSSSLLKSRIANILAARQRVAKNMIDSGESISHEEIVADDTPIVSHMSERDADFIKRVSDTITANISGENLDVGFIADAMCMSHSTLYRKVKAVTGMTVTGLVRRMRARAAADLLKEGRYTVSEIAFMVGMGSPGNFRQCFKEEFGLTPTEYLKKMKS